MYHCDIWRFNIVLMNVPGLIRFKLCGDPNFINIEKNIYNVYTNVWYMLRSSVTYDRSVVYSWNIVESGIKHHKPTKQSINLLYLGDNCIVFENFTVSIGDLMVANWVYCRRDSGANKQIFATIKSTIDAMKVSKTIQLSPF